VPLLVTQVRTAWAKLGQPATLRALLRAELGTNIHQPGGVLKDPSAAIALVWARRSLAFQVSRSRATDECHRVLLSATECY
jgi:hypothetical protein